MGIIPRRLLSNFEQVDFVLLGVSLLYLVLCPYTKVEESFNMQAAHDYLHFGEAGWDHVEFPGVVKRSSVGALVLSLVVYPAYAVLKHLGCSDLAGQLLVRAALAVFVWFTFTCLRRAIQKEYVQLTGQLFIIFTAVQFHIPFYMSRTLPNTFALAFANMAYAGLLENKPT
jgi:alpha-1,6-mannosyltransferase